jgi:carbon-monoxide dehydrogenase medium subunit
MIPAPFDYHRAGSVEEAIELLGRIDGAKLLAGGHSLLPMMKLRLAQPPAVVDIGRLDALRAIEATDSGVRVGALARHGEIAASELLAEHCPLLPEAAAQIADPAVRNRGTLGGNIAHADPASDLPAVLVALEATIHLLGPGGQRQVAAGDFFIDLLMTDLRPAEVITHVELPRLGAGTGSCYLKVEHPASGYAVCGAAALLRFEGGSVAAARLAFNGIAARPLDATAVGAALVGGAAADEAIAAAVDAHLAVGDPLGDVHASGEYRVQLAKVYGKRALRRARARAQG